MQLLYLSPFFALTVSICRMFRLRPEQIVQSFCSTPWSFKNNTWVRSNVSIPLHLEKNVGCIFYGFQNLQKLFVNSQEYFGCRDNFLLTIYAGRRSRPSWAILYLVQMFITLKTISSASLDFQPLVRAPAIHTSSRYTIIFVFRLLHERFCKDKLTIESQPRMFNLAWHWAFW